VLVVVLPPLGVALSHREVLAQPSPGLSGPRPSASEAAPPHVAIVVAPDEQRVSVLREVLGPRALGSAEIRWSSVPKIAASDVITASSAQADVAVRAWVDLSDPHVTRLYFANGKTERFLVRVIPRSPKFDAVDRDAVGQALELSVKALLDDDASGMSRRQVQALLEPAPQSAPAPPPIRPREKPAGPLLEVTALYRAQAFARDLPIAHGPGLRIALGPPGEATRFSIWADVVYQLPQAFEAQGIGADLSGVAIRGGAGAAWRLRGEQGRRPFSDMFAGGELGAGADLVHVIPVGGGAASGFALTMPYWSSAAVVTARAPLTFALAPQVDLSVAPTLDLYLTRVRYDVRDAGTVSTLLAPWAVRPGLTLGLRLR
jgi:hypothetical protein